MTTCWALIQVCDVVIFSVVAQGILPEEIEAASYDGLGYDVRYGVVSLIQLYGKSVRRES